MTLNGDNQIVELEPERTYTAREGWRTVRRWKGTKSAVQDFIPTLLIDGTNIRIIPDDGPLATVEGWYDNAQDGSDVAADAQIVTTWSVVSNELEQSVAESDYFDALAGGGGITGNQERSAIREFLAGDLSYDEAYGSVFSSEAQALVDQIAAGKTSYAISQIVLRRTKVVSGYDSAVAYLANANKVYTRAQLISAFSPPSGVQSEMPAAGEWLARNGTKEQQPSGKWVITQEFWHGDRISPVYARVA